MGRLFGGGGLLLMGSMGALVCAYAIRFLAISTGAIEAGLARIPPSLEQASRMLGETSAGTLRRVHLPLLRPALAASALLVFVDAMKELPATLLLRPMNFDTLATWLYAEAARGTYEARSPRWPSCWRACCPSSAGAHQSENGTLNILSSDLLEIDHISLAYDTPKGVRDVVRDLTLSLPAGHIGCLLGESGCGKTTVLRAIAGFELLRAGRILLDGTIISTPDMQVAPESRRVGMMFQDYALFPHLTVAQNVAFGLRRLDRAARARRVEEMLELVG